MTTQAPEITFEVGTITQVLVTGLGETPDSSLESPLEGRSADSYDQVMGIKNEELKSEERC
jgi:hypothetical protein